jgi:hypothetical protein
VLPWLAGIRAFEDEIVDGDDYFAAWKAGMAGWGVELADDGELRRNGREVGRWEPASDTRPLGDTACPFVGRRLGAIAFEVYDWATDEGDRHELFCGLFKEGRDAIWHVPTEQRWSAIHLVRRQLAHCIEKYSLDDGAELLTRRDGAYAAWCREAFAAPLIEAGYGVHMSWSATSHNCLRLSAVQFSDGRFVPAVLRDGEAVDDLDRVLASMSTELWLFDFRALGHLLDDPDLRA